MACNSIQSSSSSQMIRKYDVFVSFRGEDTRNGFTDHLLGALQRKSIPTFRDDTKLKKGEPIAPELLHAIEGSRVFIVVFSKNYASSTWCLRELAEIADCINVSGKHVLPVFYDVDPREVRKHSGNFGKALAEHEGRFKEDLEMMVQVQRWRAALTKVANLSGWDIRNTQEHREIEKIVKEVTNLLGHKCLGFEDDLVGVHSPVEELEKLLVLDSHEVVRVVGIFGMGGIGKSTLATVLYDRISHQYDACCFINDVSKTYIADGAIGVQKQFLCQALKEENLEICNLYEATYSIRTRLRHLKALIILDNVDKVEQLEELAVKREWLGAGSRIIIISRDEHILRMYGMDGLYNVQLLNCDNSLQLFSRNAFKCDDIMGDYEELTHEVLKYARGLPLAIKVLGSMLSGRSVSAWRSALDRLKETPNKNIMDVLKISYDGLDDMEKEIFLDIACFFRRCDVQHVKEILDCCGFHAEIGITVLIDKSLISISGRFITMHDLLEELGRKIVQGKSPKEPGKWSRLWRYKDFCNVTETKNIEAIVLGSSQISEMTETLMVDAEALSKMSRLRLFIIGDFHSPLWSGNPHEIAYRKWNYLRRLNCLSNELRYLKWKGCPFTFLPSSFQPNKLVHLILRDSSIKQLWEGIKYLPSLRVIDLSYSRNLIKVPDLKGVPNLEWLILQGCIKLVRIDPSIGLLKKLALLNLRNCKNLESLPNNILGLTSLEHLNIHGFSKVFRNQLLDKPRHEEHQKKLDIRETAMHSKSTSSIFKRIMLPFHSRAHKDSAGCLLPSLRSFPCMRSLDLSFCNLSQIPDAIGCMHCLETLNLGGNNFDILPCSISKLSKLIYLNLEHCKQLRYLPEMPSPTALPVVITGKYSFPAYRRGGLFIFNCPKLCEIERCRSMTFAWMLQLLQLIQESSYPVGRTDIVIPGSQIPRWFYNQNVGTSISIDPSPILHDINWIGIAFSVVFGVFDNLVNDVPPLVIWLPAKLGRSGYGIPVLLDRELATVESCHLWVLYLEREELFSFLKVEETLDLYGMKMKTRVMGKHSLHLKVKSCGYRWVFKKDLEQLNPTMMRRGSSSSSSIIQINDDFVKGGSILSLEAGN